MRNTTFYVLLITSLIKLLSFQAIAQDKCNLSLEDAKKLALSKLSPKQQVQLMSVVGPYMQFIKSFELNNGDILSIADTGPQKIELELYKQLQVLHQQGLLNPAIELLLEQSPIKEKLAELPPEKMAYAKAAAKQAIEAQIQYLSSPHYLPWDKLAERNLKLAREIADNSVNEKGEFVLTYFKREIANRFKTNFVNQDHYRVLKDSTESTQLKLKYLEESEVAYMFVWGIYDDITGQKFAETAIRRHKEGAKHYFIVDGNIAKSPGKSKYVNEMIEAGLPVILWNNPKESYQGMHRKIAVFGNKVIAGSENISDLHSGLNADKKIWLDFEFLSEGELAYEAKKLFISEWNRAIESMGLSQKKIPEPVENLEYRLDGDIALVDQAIDKHDPHNITVLNLALMMLAKKSIMINNAYFIFTPDYREVLKTAREKGVEFYLLTNSPTSVDEPIVSISILDSAKEAAKMGGQVFLREGSTLHSKYMIIDEMITQVGSMNKHPRYVIESEDAFVSTDPIKAEQVLQDFYDSIKPENASYIKDGNEVVIPIQLNTVLPMRLFFPLL